MDQTRSRILRTRLAILVCILPATACNETPAQEDTSSHHESTASTSLTGDSSVSDSTDNESSGATSGTTESDASVFELYHDCMDGVLDWPVCEAGSQCQCGECRQPCVSEAECPGTRATCVSADALGHPACHWGDDAKFCTVGCEDSSQCPRNEVCLGGACFPQRDGCAPIDAPSCAPELYTRLHTVKETGCYQYTCVEKGSAPCDEAVCNRATEFCSVLILPGPSRPFSSCATIPTSCQRVADCPCLDTESEYGDCSFTDEGLFEAYIFAP